MVKALEIYVQGGFTNRIYILLINAEFIVFALNIPEAVSDATEDVVKRDDDLSQAKELGSPFPSFDDDWRIWSPSVSLTAKHLIFNIKRVI